MFRYLALGVVRRVLTSPLPRRVILTRPISTTPVNRFVEAKAKKSTAKASTTKSKPKRKLASKAKSKSKGAGTSAKKKKVTAKKATKAKKVKVKKATVTFRREQFVVPSRPNTSGFMVFSSQERGKITNKPKTLAESQDLQKEIGQKWHNLTAEEQQVFKDKAQATKGEAAGEYDSWLRNIDPKLLREINARRKKAGKLRIRPIRSGPARPTTAFFRYLNDFTANNPGLPAIEASRRAGVEWHTLSDDVKQRYRDAFKKDMVAYKAHTGA